MPLALDFDAMAGVLATLRADRSAIAGRQHVDVPWTGIAATGRDPGQHWLDGVTGEVEEAVTWLGRRIAAVVDAVDDVGSVDGAEGRRYSRLRSRLRGEEEAF